jgi:hypothetical protein
MVPACDQHTPGERRTSLGPPQTVGHRPTVTRRPQGDSQWRLRHLNTNTPRGGQTSALLTGPALSETGSLALDHCAGLARRGTCCPTLHAGRDGPEAGRALTSAYGVTGLRPRHYLKIQGWKPSAAAGCSARSAPRCTLSFTFHDPDPLPSTCLFDHLVRLKQEY